MEPERFSFLGDSLGFSWASYRVLLAWMLFFGVVAPAEPGAEVEIRWMIKRDLPSVVQVARASQSHRWSADDFTEQLKHRSIIGMVATDKSDNVVGFMVYHLHRNRIELLNFGVLPDARRSGVGTLLMKKLVGKLVPFGRRAKVAVTVSEDDLEFQKFLQANGLWASPTEDGYRFTFETEPSVVERLEKLDLYQRLGISQNATGRQIDRALKTGLNKYSKLPQVQALLRQAHSVLSNPLQRAGYDESPRAPHPVDYQASDLPHSTRLKVSTPKPMANSYYQRLGLPENNHHPEDLELARLAAEKQAKTPEQKERVAQAYQVLRDPVSREALDRLTRWEKFQPAVTDPEADDYLDRLGISRERNLTRFGLKVAYDNALVAAAGNPEAQEKLSMAYRHLSMDRNSYQEYRLRNTPDGLPKHFPRTQESRERRVKRFEQILKRVKSEDLPPSYFDYALRDLQEAIEEALLAKNHWPNYPQRLQQLQSSLFSALVGKIDSDWEFEELLSNYRSVPPGSLLDGTIRDEIRHRPEWRKIFDEKFSRSGGEAPQQLATVLSPNAEAKSGRSSHPPSKEFLAYQRQRAQAESKAGAAGQVDPVRLELEQKLEKLNAARFAGLSPKEIEREQRPDRFRLLTGASLGMVAGVTLLPHGFDALSAVWNGLSHISPLVAAGAVGTVSFLAAAHSLYAAAESPWFIKAGWLRTQLALHDWRNKFGQQNVGSDTSSDTASGTDSAPGCRTDLGKLQ